MSRVGVVGSGISGMAAAYYLSRKHEVFLLERDTRLGGHTHTHELETSLGARALDTGFIVHNERTYPNLVRLFAELGVETQASDMSFAVFRRDGGFEYASRGLNGFFAQRGNVFRPSHYLLLKEILRFNREAVRQLDAGGNAGATTIGEFLERGRYADVFVERYLYPMASAIWSMAPADMSRFPAETLVRFFANHGMLGIHTHPQWRVVKGGSAQYIPPLTEPYRNRICLGVEITSVERGEQGVTVRFSNHAAMKFDAIVFACHARQALALLDEPSEAEREVLGSFQTSRNEACLHSDPSLLPRRGRARASWNYCLEGGRRPAITMTYHMNRLQSLDTPEDYCVTLNANGAADPSRVVRRMVYHHPLYTREAVRAQERWSEISGPARTHYCGAYWFYGFHEDGLNSGLRVARALGVDC